MGYLKKLLCLYLLVGWHLTQAQNWEWVNTAPYRNSIYNSHTLPGKNGTSWLAGTFSRDLIINPAFHDTLQSLGGTDIFILKLDAQGNPLTKALQLGGLGNDTLFDITTDSAGNLYLAGTQRSYPYNSHSYLSLIPGALPRVQAPQGTCGFVAKFHEIPAQPGGNLSIGVTWAKPVNNIGGWSSATALKLAKNNLYLAGDFYEAITVAGITIRSIALKAPSTYCIKYDLNGNALKIARISDSTRFFRPTAIGADSSEGIYICGNRYNAFQVHYLLNGGVCLLKLDSSLHLSSGYNTFELLNQNINVGSLATDSIGNSWLCGNFYGNCNFPPNPPVPFPNPQSNGGYDAFVLKLDAVGMPVWFNKIGGPFYDNANKIVLGKDSDYYVTGNFQGNNVRFGDSAYSSRGNDLFLTRFNRNNNHCLSFVTAKSRFNNSFTTVYGFSLDANNTGFISGLINDTVAFGPFIRSGRQRGGPPTLFFGAVSDHHITQLYGWQNIKIRKGWNLVSLNRSSDSLNFQHILNKAHPDSLLVKNASGNILFAKPYGIDSVKWDSLQGYQIYAEKQGYIRFYGKRISAQTGFAFPYRSEGYIVPYIGKNNISVDLAFGSVQSQIKYIQAYQPRYTNDSNGFYTWIPSMSPSAQIFDLKPGFAYRLIPDSGASFGFSFPVQSFVRLAASTSPPDSSWCISHYKPLPVTTLTNGIVYIPESACTDFVPGDEIAVTDSASNIIAAVRYSGNGLIITVPKTGYISEGQIMAFKVWKKTTHTEFETNLTWRASNGCFKADCIQTLDLIELKTPLGSSASLSHSAINMYPNPTGGLLTVRQNVFNTTSPGKLSVYSLDGVLQFATEINNASTNLNLQFLPNGLYIAELAGTLGISRHKFQIIR